MNFFGTSPRFNVGDFTYEKKGRLGPRFQKNLQLVYIYEGEATIWVDDQPNLLKANEITLLVPGHKERFAFSKTRKTHHGWCEVKQPKLEKKAKAAYEKLPFSIPLSNNIKQFAQAALEVKSNPLVSAQRVYQSIGQTIFFEYFFQVGFLDTNEKLPTSILQACKKIETHYPEPLTVHDLARAAGVSSSRLSRVFKEHLDTTPIRYLWKVRVDEGVQLLQETGLTISEIAYKTGFQTPFHFSRLVKTHYNASPKAIRQKAWQS